MSSRAAVGIAVAVALLAGLYLLRANTMAREYVGPDFGAHLVVEFSVQTKLLPTHELPLIASSIFNACRLQAEAGLQRPVTKLDGDRFRAILTPAPNATDRQQLAGCLSDLTFAHTRSGKVEMRTVEPQQG